MLYVFNQKHKANYIEPPGHLRENIVRLSYLVGLNETDCRILEFAVLIHTEKILDDSADTLGELSSLKMFHVLSVLLDRPEIEVRTSFSPHEVFGVDCLA